MSAFTGPLVIEEVQPGRRWRLVQPIKYEAGREGSGMWITVPAGTETDGASIPAALRLILAVWGSYGRAACLHDWLYSAITFRHLVGWRVRTDPVQPDVAHAYMASGLVCARRWADGEFHIAMRACGTSRVLAWSIWAAVRLFGARYCRPSDPAAGIQRSDASCELVGERGAGKAKGAGLPLVGVARAPARDWRPEKLAQAARIEQAERLAGRHLDDRMVRIFKLISTWRLLALAARHWVPRERLAGPGP